MGFRDVVGLTVEDASEGRATGSLEAGEDHLNQHGTVHGGVLATLADSVMGAAVASTTDGTPVTSALTVTFLEPGRPGRIVATAEVRKRGRRITVVECDVEQDGDALVHAVATFTTAG